MRPLGVLCELKSFERVVIYDGGVIGVKDGPVNFALRIFCLGICVIRDSLTLSEAVPWAA